SSTQTDSSAEVKLCSISISSIDGGTAGALGALVGAGFIAVETLSLFLSLGRLVCAGFVSLEGFGIASGDGTTFTVVTALAARTAAGVGAGNFWGTVLLNRIPSMNSPNSSTATAAIELFRIVSSNFSTASRPD